MKGNRRVEPGKSTIMATRKEVERGWRATSDILFAQGHPELAAEVNRFVNQCLPLAPRRSKSLRNCTSEREHETWLTDLLYADGW